MITNPIEETTREQWALLKWEYMEIVQDQMPHLWLGWSDLVSVSIALLD